MIAIFLPEHTYRGYNAPYLWVYYKFICDLKEPALFIVGNTYKEQRISSRWENDIEAQERLSYHIPNDDEIEKYPHLYLPEDLFKINYEKSGSCQFRSYITEENQRLSNYLEENLVAHIESSPIDAIITWCNCKSLQSFTNKYNIPLIHLELGPLRSPEYLSTAYFDFSGVNGNTEAEKNFIAWQANVNSESFENIHISALRKFFSTSKYHKLDCIYDIGAALQVEDDSNIVAYANDFSNQDIITYGLKNNTSLLSVRGHPGSLFKPSSTKFHIDESSNSREFISSCNKVIAINSSVILEAMLQDKEVEMFGEASFSFITKLDKTNKKSGLFFYLFAYLVPYNLIFDETYIKFRLKHPTIEQIIIYHFSYYRKSENISEVTLEYILKLLTEPVNPDFDIYTNDDITFAKFKKTKKIIKAMTSNSSDLDTLMNLYSDLEKSFIDKCQNYGYAISIVEQRDEELRRLNCYIEKMNTNNNFLKKIFKKK